MNRREDMLKEIGLWPVWRLRAAAVRDEMVVAVADIAGAPVMSSVPIPVPSVEETALSNLVVPIVAGMNWLELKAAVNTCTACDLHKTRTKAVFGVGDENADWLFVGEAPGADEDIQGEPFVGQAGNLLDNMLAAIGLKRGQNVYIANVLKSRPPQNRNPEPAEVTACEFYLKRQIELLQPKLIVALGKFAAQTLLGSEATISSLRGQTHHYQGIPLIVTYHPSYLLRTLPEKAKAWADLCFARRTMKELEATRLS